MVDMSLAKHLRTVYVERLMKDYGLVAEVDIDEEPALGSFIRICFNDYGITLRTLTRSVGSLNDDIEGIRKFMDVIVNSSPDIVMVRKLKDIVKWAQDVK